MMYRGGLTFILLLVLALSACTPAPQVVTPTSVSVAVPTAAATATPMQEAVATPTTVATPAPVATPTTASAATQSDEEIKQGIQKTMNAFAAVLRSGDQQKLTEVVDQDNRAFRRTMSEYLQQWQDVGLSSSNATFIVKSITHKRSGYVMALMNSSVRGDMTWIFRNDNGVWKISEPVESELGTIKTKDYGKYKLRYYEWDEPILPRYEKLISTMYNTVLEKTKLPMTDTITVNIWPTMATFPGLSQMSLGGTVASADPSRNQMNMRALDTFGAFVWPAGGTPEAEFEQSLEHEFTHIVHGKFISLAKVPNWMSEGLAEYISGNRQQSRLRRALQSNTLLGLKKLQDAYYFESLNEDHSVTTADTVNTVVEGYAEGESLVRYIATKYGLDKFYALNKDFADSRDMDASFKKILGINMADFERDWRVWLASSVGQ